MLGPDSSYIDEAADIAAIETALAQVCNKINNMMNNRCAMQIFVSNEVRDPNLKYNPIPLGQMQQTYWNQVVVTLSHFLVLIFLCVVQLVQLC